MRILESATPDPIPLLRDAVADVAGIHGAFLFGSAAAGEAREDSDLDIMVVEGPSVERRKLLEHLTEVGIILGREVNLVRYTPHSLAERLGDVMHPARAFVRGVLRRRKRWIAGDPKALESITAAAGIRAEELAGAA